MANYSGFAPFYDVVMGDQQPNSARVLAAIEKHLPHASSLLELGCGTGSVLTGLTSLPRLSGLDRSPEMLAIARSKVPSARFMEADMASFSLDEHFDVVICVFDTLNHLSSFGQWTEVFRRTYDHLADDGLFIFDVNPVGRLHQLSENPPWVQDFDGHTLIMDVRLDSANLSIWDIRVFEHVDNDRFRLHHERIEELGVTLERLKSALDPYFEILEEADRNGDLPTDDSPRAYFVARRR